jgi:TonB family protein
MEVLGADKTVRPTELSNIDKSKILTLEQLALPEYPTGGILEGISTDVWLRAKFSDKNKPDTVEVIFCEKPGVGFEAAAIRSALNSSFEVKSNKGNKDIEEWYYLTIPFIAEKGEWYPPHSDSNYLLVFVPDSSGNEKSPELVKRGFPKYPKEAKQKGVTGRVYVRVLVSEDGNPLKVVIKQTPDAFWKWGLNESAIEAAKECRFSPAMRNNEPVQVWISFPFEFR